MRSQELKVGIITAPAFEGLPGTRNCDKFAKGFLIHPHICPRDGAKITSILQIGKLRSENSSRGLEATQYLSPRKAESRAPSS